MSFSNRHDFLFVHVPRTAGTSIRASLQTVVPDMVHQSMHHPLASSRLNVARSFGFVRNPFDRMLSMFIVTHPNQEPSATSRDAFWHYLVGLSEYAKPASWFLDGVDRVGRFEDLQTDFSSICLWLGLPAVPELRHGNGRPHAHYAEYYDDRSLNWVLRNQADDFERYGYEWAGTGPRN